MKKLLSICLFLACFVSCSHSPILAPTPLNASSINVVEVPFKVNYIFRITNVEKTSKLLNDVRIVALDSNNNQVTLGQRFFNLQVYTGNMFEGTINVPARLHDIHFVSGAWMTDTATWTLCPYHNSQINSVELKAYKDGVLFADLSPNGIDSAYWNLWKWDASTNKILNY